ncbi:MAG: YIP1 family protein [Candidatus Micrarchaeia archaeon]
MQIENFFDEYKKAINIMVHPGKNTKEGMSIKESLKFIYTISLIPLVIGLLLTLLLSNSQIAQSPLSIVLGGGIGFVQSTIFLLLIYLVLIPLSVLIDSGFYHLIIKRLFGMYKKTYDYAFTAFTYSIIPLVFIYWTIHIPIVNILLLILFGIWSFVIEIFALSNLMGISRLMALGTIILSDVIVAVIIGVVVFVILLFLFAFGISSVMTSIPKSNLSVVPISQQSGSNLVTSANFSSCGNFTLVDSAFSNTAYRICNWNGGNVTISMSGGYSGYAVVSISSTKGTNYFQEGTHNRCPANVGQVYLPAQQYKISISTGRGGGACGPATVKLTSQS